jgi:hypothetical protein
VPHHCAHTMQRAWLWHLGMHALRNAPWPPP